MSAGQMTSGGVPIHTLVAVPVAETLATVAMARIVSVPTLPLSK